MLSATRSTVNAFRPADVLARPLGVHIQALVAALVPAVREHLPELCHTAASTMLSKDATDVDKKVYAGY